MKSGFRPTLAAWSWLAAALLMVAELLVFDRMTSQHHAHVYPRWNDQIQYLSEAYTAYEHRQAHGLVAGLKFALGKTALQGTLHDTAAVLLFSVTGPSRSAALSLNMLLFLAWQAVLFGTIARVTGSRPLAWMGFGLLLCVAAPWANIPGSAVDFRLDHGAMCLVGITACFALLADGFRARGWAVAFGVATGVTLLERFLTGAYFAVIYAGFAAWILCGDARWPRLRNLLLASLAAAALALPAFWASRAAIYNYYWVGHVSGAEGAARLRGFDLWHSTQFVFGQLGVLQLGSWFGWTVAALTGWLLALAAMGRRKSGPESGRGWLAVALFFLLVPALVLTFHRQKSEFVLGVLVPGVVLLVLWLFAGLMRRIEVPAAGWRRFAGVGPAVAALAAGGTYFMQCELTPPHTADFLASAREVDGVVDRIFTAAQKGRITNPYIAVDQVVDYFDAQILQVVCYERHKVWIPFVIQLPDSILADKDEAVLYRLKLCDFILLTDQMDGDGHWPYDHQMRRLYPEIKAWCETHRRMAHPFMVFGRHMSLYQRQETP